MKKNLLLLLLIGLVSTAALAQKNKPDASNYAPYRERTDYEMRHLGIAEFVPGMNYEQMLQDVTDAVNKVQWSMKNVKKFGDNTIEITDDDGNVHKRKSFTPSMAEDMMIRCSERVDPSLVGDLNVAGWKKSGDDIECVYKVQSAKTLGHVRGFSIGDFYKIPSMKNYWIVYQKERCLNPARKLIVMKPSAPAPQEKKSCNGCSNNVTININGNYRKSLDENGNLNIDLLDTPGAASPVTVIACPNLGAKSKAKRVLKKHFFWKKVEITRHCVNDQCVDEIVGIDTVNRVRLLPFFLFGAVAAAGIGEDYACTQNYWRGHDHSAPKSDPNPNPGTNGNDTGQTTHNIPTGHKSAQKMASNTDATHGLIVPKRFNHPDSRFTGNSLLKKPVSVLKPVPQTPPKINLNFTYKVSMNFVIGSKKPFGEVLMDGLSSLQFRPTYIIK